MELIKDERREGLIYYLNDDNEVLNVLLLKINFTLL